MGLVTLHSGLTEVNSERTAKGDDRRGDFMGVHRFQIWHTKHPVLAQRDDSGPVLGSMGLEGFCFPAIDSRSGTQRDDSGPVVGDMGLHGFCFAAIDSGVTLGPVLEIEGSCFAAIDSRSGTPNIPLGLNKMILGLVLAAWVLMDSVLLQSNTKHPVGAQRDESGPVVGDMGLCDVLKTQPKWSLSGVQA